MNSSINKNKYAIFTISDVDYAALALTMFESVSKFYQDSDFFLFIFGTGTTRKLEGNINVIYIGDILDDLDLSQRLAYYLQVELVTSVRPQCFKFLFGKNYDKAIYLDPDLYIFRRMTEIDDLLNGEVNGVVTPHALRSICSDKAVGWDNVFLQCGIFNLGFLALKNTPETMRMVSWWEEKLKWQCIYDLKNGYFVDQKWLEFLPVYFDGFHILKLPTYNLAPWNSEHYNILSNSCGEFFINDFDTPIAFIHYSGVKRSAAHYVHMKEAYNFYLNELQKRRFTKLEFVNYEVRFKQDNLYLDKVCIFLYKDYVNNTKDTKSNPLVDRGFYNFLHSIDMETGLPIYIRKLYDILPDIFVRSKNEIIDYDSLITFIKNNFTYNGVVSLETMVQLRNDSIGLDYEIQHTNFDEIDHDPIKTDSPPRYTLSTQVQNSPHYPAILSFSNGANPISQTTIHRPRKIILKSDRIEIISGAIRVCVPHIDKSEILPNLSDMKAQNYTEIWVPSAYCKEKLRKSARKGSKPKIKIVPYPVLKPHYKILTTDLPSNKLVVMLCHDFNLDFATQNPLASLKAFQGTFGQKSDMLLVCFLVNVNKNSEDYKGLVKTFSDEKNAIIVEGTPDNDLYYSYLHYAHCFISLHQETIFGYALAEAMSLGKYVIATNKGGNVEYMNSDNSFLINSTSPKECISEATKMLISIYNDTDVLNAKSKQARLHIQKHLSPNSVGLIMQKRLERKPSLFVRLRASLNRRKLRKIKMRSIISILLKNVNRPAILE